MDPAAPRTPPPRGFVLATAASFEGGLVVLWVVLGRIFGVHPADQGRPTAAAAALGAAAAAPLIALLPWIVRSGLRPVRRLVETVDGTIVPFLTRLRVVDFAIISLLAGVGEEGLFRGLLQGGAARIMPETAAVLVSAGLFGLLHFVTPAYAVMAALIGVYLGWLRAATGNVVVPMTAHALYDFAALVYLVKLRTAGERPGPGGKDL